MLNSEEIEPIALAVIKLCLFEGVSQIVSQYKNLLNKKFFEFHSNLMQRFRVNLKTFWAWLCLTNATIL